MMPYPGNHGSASSGSVPTIAAGNSEGLPTATLADQTPGTICSPMGCHRSYSVLSKLVATKLASVSAKHAPCRVAAPRVSKGGEGGTPRVVRRPQLPRLPRVQLWALDLIACAPFCFSRAARSSRTCLACNFLPSYSCNCLSLVRRPKALAPAGRVSAPRAPPRQPACQRRFNCMR